MSPLLPWRTIEIDRFVPRGVLKRRSCPPSSTLLTRWCESPTLNSAPETLERDLFIDNLLVRTYFIIDTIWWSGLAPWEYEFPFPGSLVSASRNPTPCARNPKCQTPRPETRDFRVSGTPRIQGLDVPQDPESLQIGPFIFAVLAQNCAGQRHVVRRFFYFCLKSPPTSETHLHCVIPPLSLSLFSLSLSLALSFFLSLSLSLSPSSLSICLAGSLTLSFPEEGRWRFAPGDSVSIDANDYNNRFWE